jgi:drug/metabolite transporter (DMT)-like permease
MTAPLNAFGRTRRQVLLADLALLTVAMGWGFNFVVIKDAISRMGVLDYLLLRHIVATILLVALLPRSALRARGRDWLYGAVLGGVLFAAFAAQTIALQHTSPAHSGFITGLSVAMVPFLYWMIARRSPGWPQIGGALIATAGLGVLSLRGDWTMSWGDGITLLATVGFALQITATGFLAPRVKPATLAITQVAVATALLAVFTPFFEHVTLALSWRLWAAIFWTALMGTVYAFLVQFSAQRHTSSTHAAIILGLESVFAALFGIVFGMDHLSWRLLGGAVLILAGIVVVELWPGRGGAAAGRAAAPVAALPRAD